ncbi:MAG: hypothetical protein WCG14_03370 [Chlamydiia bacterium]
MNVNQTAFCAVTALSIASGGAIIAAATAASTVSAIAWGILGIASSGAAIGASTAWMASKPGDSPTSYLEAAQTHTGIAIASTCNLASSLLIDRVIKTGAQALADKLYDKIMGREDTKTLRFR